ncbi:hypothetical protein DPMN_117043 [Dreissena polymorpha]|uniref:Uncharacterized protein n=1 Tax=Dreissena polymorpha TaxID=45954 RepID=A0A9D4QUI4_DREPO|nr:hypothetical protein DPMN_117043 [Dreissena polymorpha]
MSHGAVNRPRSRPTEHYLPRSTYRTIYHGAFPRSLIAHIQEREPTEQSYSDIAQPYREDTTEHCYSYTVIDHGAVSVLAYKVIAISEVLVLAFELITHNTKHYSIKN